MRHKLYYVIVYHHRHNSRTRFHVSAQSQHDAEMQVGQHLGTPDWRIEACQFVCLTNDTVFLEG